VAGRRLSQLQQWILKTTFEKGFDSSGDDVGKFILRNHLIFHWLNENWKGKPGEDWKWIHEVRPKFNVSLTRSIKNLHEKELIRTFSISKPDLFLTGEFGLAWKMDVQSAKLSRGLKLLQNQGSADTTKEDDTIAAYQAAKEAQKEGRFELKEIKADDKHSSVQAIALTGKGRELTLMLTLPETQKINNKEPTRLPEI
jgi:hypothetical protein